MIEATAIDLCRHTMDLISATHNQHYENYRYLVLGTCCYIEGTILSKSITF